MNDMKCTDRVHDRGVLPANFDQIRAETRVVDPVDADNEVVVHRRHDRGLRQAEQHREGGLQRGCDRRQGLYCTPLGLLAADLGR